ncbi:Imidazolonepropionase [Tistlia consotensis]|uniref:Imidazolonepropionase n=1 Tax=Tistlia consotensis USBA 355 TaxID=560819 RepID=A0A1Y6BR21_9PROT|nr:amidohydrolase family protein [Tistlia consotensis]SMF16520.1 Imidazolonepropionase [Tistlia consotensis USBA 355]SNR41083.1 Imidazolonepropionase [Tistlia consotensis]
MSQRLFIGGKVIDGDGKALEGHGVLVSGERIARVAPAAEFEGFAGERVDTAGMTLLPGLIDCHVHLCSGAEADPGSAQAKLSAAQIAMRALERAQTTLAGGITAVRDCGGKDYIEFAVRDACNAGIQLGPTIMASGRMICMTGGHGNRNGRVADGVDEVVKAVREQIHAGCDFVKIMATGGVMTPGVDPQDAHYSPEEMAAGIAEGHRFHRTCASHAQGEEGILNAVRGGIDSIEHGFFLTEKTIEEMMQRGTYLVATLSALRNILGNGHLVQPYVIEKSRKYGEFHVESVKRYYAAGGKMAMGTDAGTPFNKHGENAQELRFLVEVGVKPMDAITIATRNGADLMRLEERGTVTEGKFADLLVVYGDPLADIAAVADPANHALVVKNGRVAADKRASAAEQRRAAE